MISGAISESARELAAQLARQFGKGRRAGPASDLMHVGLAMDGGVTIEQIQNILIAVAPIGGTTSAALNITKALGIAIVALEDELEAQEDAR